MLITNTKQKHHGLVLVQQADQLGLGSWVKLMLKLVASSILHLGSDHLLIIKSFYLISNLHGSHRNY